MASITPRGKNKWFVRVFHRREQGKVKFHDKLINGNKKDADAYARKIETARDSGTLDELLNPPTLTLNAYLDRWLKESVKPSVRESTYNDYQDILKRYVRPALGAHLLAGIRPPDVQAIYNELKERGLSTRTIQYTHAVLTSALKQAVGWQLLKLNPADYTKRPKNESDALDTAEAEKIRVLTPKDAEAFLDACKGDLMGAALTFALATGARPEEYLALRWSDVDFDKGEVRIQRVVQWHRKAEGGSFYFLPPKTRKSRRTLRVSKSVLRVLQEHRRADAATPQKGRVLPATRSRLRDDGQHALPASQPSPPPHDADPDGGEVGRFPSPLLPAAYVRDTRARRRPRPERSFNDDGSFERGIYAGQIPARPPVNAGSDFKKTRKTSIQEPDCWLIK